MTTMTANKESSCHWLPCSIDYDGFAPVHIYFNPQTIPPSSGVTDTKNAPSNIISPSTGEECNQKHDETCATTTDSNPNHSTLLQAASFRGRGLISKSVSKPLPNNVVGTVLTIPEFSSSSYNTIKMGESFHHIVEWHHEWNEQKVLDSSFGNGDGSDVSHALDLLEVLHAVHDPL